MVDGYANIKNGILKQAVDDYKRALTRGEKAEAKALERWFTSDWGEMLSNGNGELIIEKVRKELKI